MLTLLGCPGNGPEFLHMHRAAGGDCGGGGSWGAARVTRGGQDGDGGDGRGWGGDSGDICVI